MDPPVKRSGWQPPQDTGLWKAADRVSQEVWGVLRQGQRERLKARFASAKPRLVLHVSCGSRDTYIITLCGRI